MECWDNENKTKQNKSQRIESEKLWEIKRYPPLHKRNPVSSQNRLLAPPSPLPPSSKGLTIKDCYQNRLEKTLAAPSQSFITPPAPVVIHHRAPTPPRPLDVPPKRLSHYYEYYKPLSGQGPSYFHTLVVEMKLANIIQWHQNKRGLIEIKTTIMTAIYLQ